MEHGVPGAADKSLPVGTSLKDVSHAFAEGASVLSFCDEKQNTVGYMRREKLGEALAAVEFGVPLSNLPN